MMEDFHKISETSKTFVANVSDRNLLRALYDFGRVKHFFDLDESLTYSAGNSEEVSMIAVEFSNNTCIDRLIRKLVRFRVSVPSVPVLLASSVLRRDDYSSTRWPICDCSIKLPASTSDISLALAITLANHQARLDAREERIADHKAAS